jgi:hypothetical protein
MTSDRTLWQSVDCERFFIVPDEFAFETGAMAITNRLGRIEQVDPRCIEPFELRPDQAHRWAREELGLVLEELRLGADARLSEAREQLANLNSNGRPLDAAPALLDLLKSLPGVIGKSLSGDEQHLETARETMSTLQQRLRDAGIDVDERVKGFADRLASIRTDIEAEKRAGKEADDDQHSRDDKP